MVLNSVKDKVKIRCKLSYKVLKEEDGYHPLLDIYSYITFIQFKDFLVRIYHCVTVFGKWVFDSNFPFALPLTKDNFDYCCNNGNNTKLIKVCKGVLKAIRVFKKRMIKVSFISENLQHVFGNIKMM